MSATNTTIIRYVNRYWNGATATGDLYPGTSTNGYSGQPNQYQGQLLTTVQIGYGVAASLSDPASATPLQGGDYQYVQFAADSTNYLQGQLLYWKDETKAIVTNVAPTATSANFAGFCIAPVTQGNYWFVCVAGVAYAQFAASVGSTTASTGVYAVVNTNTVNALADATADATSGVNKLFIGIAKDAPANSGILRVYIKSVCRVS